MKNTIAISSDFFDAFIILDKKTQNKVRRFFEKFINDPHLPGLNKELISKIENRPVYSIRIDDNFRGVIWEENSTTFHLLWVAKHDVLYEWIERKTKAKISDAMVLTPDYYKNKEISNTGGKGLFINISNKELFNIGVPLHLIDIVKQIPDLDALGKIEPLFAKDVYAKLEWLTCGLKVNEIISEEEKNRKTIIEYLEKEMFFPALENEYLDSEIKKHIKNTYDRIVKNMDTARKIIDFIEDALDSDFGKEIHDKLKLLDLNTFEDLFNDLKKYCM